MTQLQNKQIIMKCGCNSQGTRTQNGVTTPLCWIHNETEVAPADYVRPNVSGRTACCETCNKRAPSSWNLPFFRMSEHESESDTYFCGCAGFD